MKSMFCAIMVLILMSICFVVQAAPIDPGISAVASIDYAYTKNETAMIVDADKEVAVMASTESLAMASYLNGENDSNGSCMACSIGGGSSDYLSWSQEPPDYGGIRV